MNKLSSLSMNILNMDESSTWNSERVMITQLAHLIQTDVPQMPFMKALKFDPNKHSPNCINNFKLLIQSSDSLHLSDFRLASARLARNIHRNAEKSQYPVPVPVMLLVLAT